MPRIIFLPAAETVDELRAGLSGGSFGKGSTAEQGEASALMEAIERYSGIFQGDEIRVTRRFTDFPPGDAIHPNDVLLFSDAQLRRDLAQATGPDEVTPMPAPFDRSAKIEWSPVWSLRDQRFKYLPTSLLYFFYRGPGYQIHADSNGCAAGNTLEEAIVQGFLELVERDAYAIWWYNRLQRAEVDLDQFDDSYIRDLQSPACRNRTPALGARRHQRSRDSDLRDRSRTGSKTRRKIVEFGSGAHFDARIASLRALTELNQFLSIGLMGGGTRTVETELIEPHDGSTPLRLQDHPYLTPKRRPGRCDRTSARSSAVSTRASR